MSSIFEHPHPFFAWMSPPGSRGDLGAEGECANQNLSQRSVSLDEQLKNLRTKCAALETEVEIMQAHLSRSETERFHLISVSEIILDNFARLGLACRRELWKLKNRIRWLYSKMESKESQFSDEEQTLTCDTLDPKTTLSYEAILNYLHSPLPKNQSDGSAAMLPTMDSSLTSIFQAQLLQNHLNRLCATTGVSLSQLRNFHFKRLIQNKSSCSGSTSSSSSTTSSSSSSPEPPPSKEHVDTTTTPKVDNTLSDHNAWTTPDRRREPPSNRQNVNTDSKIYRDNQSRSFPRRNDRSHLTEPTRSPHRTTSSDNRKSSSRTTTRRNISRSTAYNHLPRYSKYTSHATRRRSQANVPSRREDPHHRVSPRMLSSDNLVSKSTLSAVDSAPALSTSATGISDSVGAHLLRVVEGCVRQIRDHHAVRRSRQPPKDTLMASESTIKAPDNVHKPAVQESTDNLSAKAAVKDDSCTVYTKRLRSRLEHAESKSTNEDFQAQQNLNCGFDSIDAQKLTSDPGPHTPPTPAQSAEQGASSPVSTLCDQAFGSENIIVSNEVTSPHRSINDPVCKQSFCESKRILKESEHNGRSTEKELVPSVDLDETIYSPVALVEVGELEDIREEGEIGDDDDEDDVNDSRPSKRRNHYNQEDPLQYGPLLRPRGHRSPSLGTRPNTLRESKRRRFSDEIPRRDTGLTPTDLSGFRYRSPSINESRRSAGSVRSISASKFNRSHTDSSEPKADHRRSPGRSFRHSPSPRLLETLRRNRSNHAAAQRRTRVSPSHSRRPLRSRLERERPVRRIRPMSPHRRSLPYRVQGRNTRR